MKFSAKQKIKIKQQRPKHTAAEEVHIGQNVIDTSAGMFAVRFSAPLLLQNVMGSDVIGIMSVNDFLSLSLRRYCKQYTQFRFDRS